MKHFSIFLLVLFAFPAWNCKKDSACDCFKGTGDIVTEVRDLPVFHDVYVEDNVNLIFQEDTVQRVTVEAGKHLVKGIKTSMDGDLLKIKNNNTCNFVRRYDIPVNVYIHYKRNQFFRIRTKGTGLISNSNPCTSDSIDLNSESSGDIQFTMGGNGLVYTHQHGAGDITLNGSCGQILIYSIGSGFTTTENCANDYTWVFTNTTGKITVTPSNILTTIINGSGNVYYKIHPGTINSFENGSGKLLPL